MTNGEEKGSAPAEEKVKNSNDEIAKAVVERLTATRIKPEPLSTVLAIGVVVLAIGALAVGVQHYRHLQAQDASFKRIEGVLQRAETVRKAAERRLRSAMDGLEQISRQNGLPEAARQGILAEVGELRELDALLR